MKRDYRIDKGGRITSKMDDNGFLRIDGVAAHVGILEYMDDGGSIIKEFVPEDTLFDPASLASLAGAPVTLQHPPEMVTPGNYAKYAQGSVNGNPKRDGDNLVVSLSVIGNEALHAVESGVDELSPGYSVDLDETPGEWNGQPYDRVQRNRRYNHQAIVDAARGGEVCSLRFDGIVPTNEDIQMTQIKLPGGGTVEVADAATAATINAAIAKQGKRLDSTKVQLKKLVKAISPKLKLDADDVLKENENADADEAVAVDVPAVESAVSDVAAAIDNLQAQLDELADAAGTPDATVVTDEDDTDPNKMDDDTTDPELKTDSLSKMLTIIENAKKLKPGISHLDGKRVKTSRQIQVEALIASKPGFNADGKSDAYISGRFDAACEGLKTRNDSLRTQRHGFNLDSVIDTKSNTQADFNSKFYKGEA